jgi:L-galactose dehydrogenase/L-glyceraldehyde 3-phosphate reductase
MIDDDVHCQRELVRRVLDAGINWIDTAAGYGDGRAERALGAALAALGAAEQAHVATKVRLLENQLGDIPGAVRASVAASLQRLGLKQLTLLQVHNAITAKRDDEPTSITPQDVLGPGGMLEAFKELQRDGTVRFLGITAIGQPRALAEVIDSGQFDTIQVPYNLVNLSAGQDVPSDFSEANYGNAIQHAARQRMGVFAIRVYAGGVLAGNPPSRHAQTTKFFPLDLFQRDQVRVERLRQLVTDKIDIKELAARFPLSHPDVTSAIVGFSEPGHVDEAIRYLRSGPLPVELLDELRPFTYR